MFPTDFVGKSDLLDLFRWTFAMKSFSTVMSKTWWLCWMRKRMTKMNNSPVPYIIYSIYSRYIEREQKKFAAHLKNRCRAICSNIFWYIVPTTNCLSWAIVEDPTRCPDFVSKKCWRSASRMITNIVWGLPSHRGRQQQITSYDPNELK